MECYALFYILLGFSDALMLAYMSIMWLIVLTCSFVYVSADARWCILKLTAWHAHEQMIVERRPERALIEGRAIAIAIFFSLCARGDASSTCGNLVPIPTAFCPSNPDLLRCDSSSIRNSDLCEGDGECGTNTRLDNCGAYDVYRKFLSTSPTVITSDGSATRPHCTWHSVCNWNDKTKNECALYLCKASGFKTGTFRSGTHMCKYSQTSRSAYHWVTDRDEYVYGSYTLEASITARCGGLVDGGVCSENSDCLSEVCKGGRW